MARLILAVRYTTGLKYGTHRSCLSLNLVCSDWISIVRYILVMVWTKSTAKALLSCWVVTIQLNNIDILRAKGVTQ